MNAALARPRLPESGDLDLFTSLGPKESGDRAPAVSEAAYAHRSASATASIALLRLCSNAFT